MGNIVTTARLSEKGKKISEVVSLIVVSLLFLAVLLYAGFRGHYAYDHDPASLTKYEERETVKYPSVTVCPLSQNIPLQPIDCILEYQEVSFLDCMFAVRPIAILYDGKNRTCFTFNYDGSLVSKSPNDDFTVKVALDTATASNDTLLGVVTFLHSENEEPTLNTVGSFIADVGKFTNVWLRINYYEYVDNSKKVQYTANKVSSASIASLPVPGFVQLNFLFPESGVYKTTEYYPYTIHNWIGEVGGFACLMTFIHFTIIIILTLILMKLTPAPKPNTDSSDDQGSGAALGDAKM